VGTIRRAIDGAEENRRLAILQKNLRTFELCELFVTTIRPGHLRCGDEWVPRQRPFDDAKLYQPANECEYTRMEEHAISAFSIRVYSRPFAV